MTCQTRISGKAIRPLFAEPVTFMVPYEMLEVARCVTNSVRTHSDVGIGLILIVLQKFRYLLRPAAYIFLLAGM